MQDDSHSVLATYESVSDCARWRDVDPHKIIRHLARKMGVPAQDLRQFFFNAMQWTLDNRDKTGELWGKE